MDRPARSRHPQNGPHTAIPVADLDAKGRRCVEVAMQVNGYVLRAARIGPS